MNFYTFATVNPWLTFFLCWLVLAVGLKLVNRVLRHWNIRKHGYPPAHCDADGDFKPEKKDGK